MPTILTKKSDTPGAVPATANLTNAAGGAELAVNTADRRMFTINSSSAVVELGTNPGSLTCADASFTVARISSGTVTQLTSTSATVTTLTAMSASVTNLTATSIVISNLSIASANITTLTSTNATAASLTVSTGNLAFSGTGQRITGDMSNATLSNRLMFQNSVTNGASQINVLPNGTSQTSLVRLINNSDPANAGTTLLYVDSGESSVRADRTGTGTYLPMTFHTGGSERMRLDTSGNLGIGNTVASTINTVNGVGNLVVGSGSGSEGITIYTGTADTGGIAFADGTTTTDTYRGYINYAHATDHMAFWTAATERMRIDSSGNVGIGTASPSAKLHSFTSSAAQINNLIQNSVSYLNYGVFGDGNNYLYSGTATNLLLGTNNTERMRIDSSGNVGIGTASPSSKLQISNGTAVDTQVQITNSVSTLKLSSFSDGSGAVETTGAYALRFFTDATERMRVSSNGNVGIGGTASAFVKLQLSGTYPTGSNVTRTVFLDGTIPSGTTNTATGFHTSLNTQAASFTNANLVHFYATQGTFGAGSTVTTQYGYFADSSLTGATNNYGFYSNIASGSNRFNFYANGTATNYFAGKTGIGITSPTYEFEVNGIAAVVNSFGAFTALQSAGGTGYRWTLANDASFRLQYTTNGFSAVTTPIHVDSNGNVGFGTTSFGASSQVVLAIANATAVPTGNPTGGGVLYVEAGALKYRGSSGTVTTIANA